MTIYDGRDRFGRYLDEHKVGDVYKHWPGKTITETDGHQFALLTMNHNPLHFDQNLMSKSQFGKTLVVGTYVLSLTVGLSVPDTSGKAIANLEYESIVHNRPTHTGDTIYSESEVLDVRESKTKPHLGVVYVETRAHNQRGEKVLTLRRRYLVPKSSAASK